MLWNLVAEDLVQGHAKNVARMLGYKIREGEILAEADDLEVRVATLEAQVHELADAIGHEFEE
jgi:hypothetical protein